MQYWPAPAAAWRPGSWDTVLSGHLAWPQLIILSEKVIPLELLVSAAAQDRILFVLFQRYAYFQICFMKVWLKVGSYFGGRKIGNAKY